MTKPIWFVRRAFDNRILCVDNIWRIHPGYVENIKFFKRATNAIKFGLKYAKGTVFAIHPTDNFDCCGCINEKETHA